MKTKEEIRDLYEDLALVMREVEVEFRRLHRLCRARVHRRGDRTLMLDLTSEIRQFEGKSGSSEVV